MARPPSSGNKPIPRNLVLLAGPPRSKRRLDPKEPQPEVSKPDAPDYLDERHKAAFDLFAGRLAAMRVMTAADTEAVVLLASAWVDWQDACDSLKKYSPILKTPSGYIQTSPYVAMKNRAWDEVQRMLIECGLTPSGRRRVQMV